MFPRFRHFQKKQYKGSTLSLNKTQSKYAGCTKQWSEAGVSHAVTVMMCIPAASTGPRAFHNAKEIHRRITQAAPSNSFLKDNEKSQPFLQKNGRPMIIDSGDDYWTVVHKDDCFRFDFRSELLDPLFEWVFDTWHRWDVKAFPVPLFLTNRLKMDLVNKVAIELR